MAKKLKLHKNFDSQHATGDLYRGDALEFLERRKTNCADIVFLDPPFNLKKMYDKSKKLDHLSDTEYVTWITKIIEQSIRVLKPGGALYFYNIPRWAIEFAPLLKAHLDFRHWIAVSMKNGFVRTDSLYPAHYALLYFTKGTPNNFDRPKIAPAECRHCGGYVKDYGGYRKIIDEKGINVSDIWDDFSPVRHRRTKNRGPNELPIGMLDRVLHISGTKNGLLIDPFVGSGTSALAAAKHGMKFRVCDIVEENLSITENRVNDWLEESRSNGFGEIDGSATRRIGKRQSNEAFFS